MSRLKELSKKAADGKASVAEYLEMAELAGKEAKQVGKKAFKGNIKKLKAFAKELGLDAKEAAEALYKQPIFQWGDKVKFSGIKGQMPAWVKDLLKEVPSKADAMLHALNAEGREFVEKVYNPKTKKAKKA